MTDTSKNNIKRLIVRDVFKQLYLNNLEAYPNNSEASFNTMNILYIISSKNTFRKQGSIGKHLFDEMFASFNAIMMRKISRMFKYYNHETDLCSEIGDEKRLKNSIHFKRIIDTDVYEKFGVHVDAVSKGSIVDF